jgi:acetylornithine/N-succinyldiaminopimelate aminotransferase
VALDVIDDPGFLEHVDEMGALLAEGLRELPGVTEVRGRGLMVAAEVTGDAPELARRSLVEQRLVINATGPGTLRFLPPLVVEADEILDALGRLRALLAA